MDKAIIVIDMPKSCSNCKCSFTVTNSSEWYCFLNGHGRIKEYMINHNKPDWCPLKELPKKKKYHEGTFNGLVKGWNLCIDEILKN